MLHSHGQRGLDAVVHQQLGQHGLQVLLGALPAKALGSASPTTERPPDSVGQPPPSQQEPWGPRPAHPRSPACFPVLPRPATPPDTIPIRHRVSTEQKRSQHHSRRPLPSPFPPTRGHSRGQVQPHQDLPCVQHDSNGLEGDDQLCLQHGGTVEQLSRTPSYLPSPRAGLGNGWGEALTLWFLLKGLPSSHSTVSAKVQAPLWGGEEGEERPGKAHPGPRAFSSRGGGRHRLPGGRRRAAGWLAP